MRVVFFGTPAFAVPTLERLLHHPDFTVVGTVTQPDRRRGRGSQLVPSAVKQLALNHNIPIWQPQRIKKDPAAIAELKNLQADVFVVVAYGQILSREILDLPRLGCINVHGSLLPQYRGAAPIQWCLFNGDRETGITTMLMDEGMDTGAMLLKSFTAIGLLDNAQHLAQRLAQQGADLLIDTLQALQQGSLTLLRQDNALATYAPLIQKSDYLIDWHKTAIALHNQIRGFYPHCHTPSLKVLATIPLAFLDDPGLLPELQELARHFNPQSLKQGEPGEIVGIVKHWGPIVQTQAGYLLLTELQLSGKRAQSGWDLVNGNHLAMGDRL
jgi:methionyl-tRNA formyltransferase